MLYYFLAIFYAIASIGWSQESNVTSSTEEQINSFNALRTATRATTVPQKVADINAQLRPHDITYMPEGNGPFPVVLFFHGCSGRTLSHEKD